jgi:hypothetical protein
MLTSQSASPKIPIVSVNGIKFNGSDLDGFNKSDSLSYEDSGSSSESGKSKVRLMGTQTMKWSPIQLLMYINYGRRLTNYSDQDCTESTTC